MKKNDNNREVAQALAMVAQFGINMLVPIFACTFFGAWLGEKLDISWLAIPFFAIGALAGMRNVFLFAKRISRPRRRPGEDAEGRRQQEREEKDKEEC